MQMLAVIRISPKDWTPTTQSRGVVAEPVGETRTTTYGLRTTARIEEKHS
jgi:hypothetical protein